MSVSSAILTMPKVRSRRWSIRVTIDNPPVNVLDVALMADLRRLLTTLRGDESVRVIVFQALGELLRHQLQ